MLWNGIAGIWYMFGHINGIRWNPTYHWKLCAFRSWWISTRQM
jgi:hypothetical protein